MPIVPVSGNVVAIAPALVAAPLSAQDPADILGHTTATDTRIGGIVYLRAMGYPTHERWVPRTYFGGSHEEARATCEKWNPANPVDRGETPMLVCPDENLRVPGARNALPGHYRVFASRDDWLKRDGAK